MTGYGDDNDNDWYSFWKYFDYNKYFGFMNSGGFGGDDDDDDDDNDDHTHDDVDQSPIDHANISFHIETRDLDYNGKDSQQNIIDQCIFSSEQFFEPLCVKCKFLDEDGTTVVAKGKVFEPAESYEPNTEIPILMTSVPPVEDGFPANNDVRNVHGVKITICGFDCEPVFADFKTLPHGTREDAINTAMAPAGISVSAVANAGGVSEVIIFDGDTDGGPTDTNAQPDPDLRADGNTGDANSDDGICPDCAGKHFLIIAENIVDSNPPAGIIDTPDDSAAGGTIKVEMDTPKFLKSFVLADLEKNQNAKAVAYDAANNVIKTVNLPSTGDGKLLTINMNAKNTKRLEVTYYDSGAITNIDLKCEPPKGEGCTPGFWKQKQHFSFWKTYKTTDKFAATFGINGGKELLKIKVDNKDYTLKEATLLQALKAQGGELNALARHAVAALLNAASGMNYEYTVDEVKSMVKAAIMNGSYQTTKDKLEEANEKGCPFDKDCDCDDRKDHYYKYYENHEKYYKDNKNKFKSSDYTNYMNEHMMYLDNYGKYMEKSDYKMHTDFFKKFLDENKKKFSSKDYNKYSEQHKKYSKDYNNHHDDCDCDKDDDGKDHYDKDDKYKGDKDYKYKYGKDHDDDDDHKDWK
jgi:hypothetical protein